MIVAYVTAHGLGHLMRTLEVLRAIRETQPTVPITVVGTVPGAAIHRALRPPVDLRVVACDVGVVQQDALVIDERETVRRCAEFDATWEARVDAEAEYLRRSQARAVIGDIPPLAFAAAARAEVPSFALGHFGWDWIYRHLSRRLPALAASADVAASAYAQATMLLELPFAAGVSAFPVRERVGLVARRSRLGRREARIRLRLGDRPTVLVSFGGIGVAALERSLVLARGDHQLLWPGDVTDEQLDGLGMYYPDVVAAVDVVLTKPGYGIVAEAIAAGTRVAYTDRGDFPEYPVLVREMSERVPCEHVSRDDLLSGRFADVIDRLLARPAAHPVQADGAERAARYVLRALS